MLAVTVLAFRTDHLKYLILGGGDKEDIKHATTQSPDYFDAFSCNVSVMAVSKHLSCLLIFLFVSFCISLTRMCFMENLTL